MLSPSTHAPACLHAAAPRLWAAWCALLCTAGLLPGPARAQSATEAAGLLHVQQFTLDAARHAAPGRRVEVQVGALDARLKLAPCERTEPYLPNMARLWGYSRIGLRCTQGPVAWNVFVPVTVKVFGPAFVAAAPLPAGRLLTPADLAQAEVDLADEPSSAITDTQAALGRTLLRPLAAGQALRQAHLKARQWFAAGDEVRVVARGAGFSAVASGQALTPGIEGQAARVRIESGRIVTGSPVAPGAIDLTL